MDMFSYLDAYSSIGSFVPQQQQSVVNQGIGNGTNSLAYQQSLANNSQPQIPQQQAPFQPAPVPANQPQLGFQAQPQIQQAQMPQAQMQQPQMQQAQIQQPQIQGLNMGPLGALIFQLAKLCEDTDHLTKALALHPSQIQHNQYLQKMDMQRIESKLEKVQELDEKMKLLDEKMHKMNNSLASLVESLNKMVKELGIKQDKKDKQQLIPQQQLILQPQQIQQQPMVPAQQQQIQQQPVLQLQPQQIQQQQQAIQQQTMLQPQQQGLSGGQA